MRHAKNNRNNEYMSIQQTEQMKENNIKNLNFFLVHFINFFIFYYI